jgi:hypothetical protein
MCFDERRSRHCFRIRRGDQIHPQSGIPFHHIPNTLDNIVPDRLVAKKDLFAAQITDLLIV